MEKKNKGIMIFTSLLCLLPSVFGLMVYDQLPRQMAVHFNNAGEPDNYVSKALAVFGLPLLMCLVNVIVQVTMEYDPRKRYYPQSFKNVMKCGVPLLAVVAEICTLLYALGRPVSIEVIIPLAVGILIIVCGNYLPKCRQNFVMGIKNPWTLHSEENWNKTHRLAGIVWILGGIFLCAAPLLGNIGVRISIAVVVIMVCVPTAYSFLLFRKGI